MFFFGDCIYLVIINDVRIFEMWEKMGGILGVTLPALMVTNVVTIIAAFST